MSVVRLFCVLFIAGVSARSIRSTEEKLENEVTSYSCKCDRRYWAHYEARGCQPLFEEDKIDCPARFDCPDFQTSDSEKCIFRGIHYDIGSNINTGNPCNKCFCSRSQNTNSSYISCIGVECPDLFGEHLKEGCHYVYSEDRCCPVKIECEAKESPKCKWNNKTYYLGEKIYSEEDPCLVCLCTEDWEGLSSKSCYKVDCVIEKNLQLLQQGCIPIYHEKSCCPIEYHCPENMQQNEEAKESSRVKTDVNQCYFDGKAYNRGEVLDYNHTTSCVTCTCCTSPDFTCVQKACLQPSLGYSKCRAIYKQGTCCPEYDCSTETSKEEISAEISEEKETEIFGPPHSESPCADVHCEEGEHCQLKQICEEDSCRIYPQCVFINANCPTPLCATGCYIVDIDKDRCPTCACDNNSLTRRNADVMCLLPNCTGSNCHLVSNEDGCPVCSCDPPCPVCPPSCQVQTDIPEGRCPECICNEVVEKSNAETISCPEPACHGINCTTKIGEDNCTYCVCIECSPPKCNPECELETDPSGGCPKCQCPIHENTETPSCPVPVCDGINCTMKIGEDNCTHCVCLECPLSKCEPGCKLEVDAFGGCPKCECPVIESPEKPSCPVPVCEGVNCTMQTGEDNCTHCVCLTCSIPKCEPDCKLENDASGGCPKCECPKIESANDHTTTVGAIDISSTETQKCPELKCRGYNCRILIGTDGCQLCTCESKCPPTRCIPGCFVEKNPLPDHCPGCICHIATTSKDVASNES